MPEKTPPFLTQDEFAAYLDRVCEEKISHGHYRWGQAYFNVLYEINPELANSIRSGPLDPFYQDHRIPDFLDAILI